MRSAPCNEPAGLKTSRSIRTERPVFRPAGGEWVYQLILHTNCISRPLGGLVCFYANKHWTFGNRGRHRTSTQFIRFWCVFLMSLGLSEALIWLAHDVLEVGPRASKLSAEAICVAFNYLCLRLWTFR